MDLQEVVRVVNDEGRQVPGSRREYPARSRNTLNMLCSALCPASYFAATIARAGREPNVPSFSEVTTSLKVSLYRLGPCWTTVFWSASYSW